MSKRRLFIVGLCAAPVLLLIWWLAKLAFSTHSSIDAETQKTILDDMSFSTDHANHSLPAFSFTIQDGKKTTTTTLKAFHGKSTLVHIWATWCPACVQEYKAFDAFVRAHKNKYNIISLNVDLDNNLDVTLKTVRDFWAKNKFAHIPTIFDHKAVLTRSFSIQATPCTILINPQGKEIGRFNGMVAWDDADFLFTLHKVFEKDLAQTEESDKKKS